MTRLKSLNPEQATGKTKELFDAIQNKLGMVPNMMRTMGNSPALLEGYLNLNSSLSAGSLGPKTGELIALAVAEANSCDYCLSAHTFIGEKLVGIDQKTLLNSREGKSPDPKVGAALRFAKILVAQQGIVADEDINELKNAGFSEGEVAEIVGHVALNILTNYFNNTAQTEIDFPVVKSFNIAVV